MYVKYVRMCIHSCTMINLILMWELQCVSTYTYVMGHDAYVPHCGTFESLVAMGTYTCISWYSRIWYESEESENSEGNHSWVCDGPDSNLSCPRGLMRLGLMCKSGLRLYYRHIYCISFAFQVSTVKLQRELIPSHQNIKGVMGSGDDQFETNLQC